MGGSKVKITLEIEGRDSGEVKETVTSLVSGALLPVRQELQALLSPAQVGYQQPALAPMSRAITADVAPADSVVRQPAVYQEDLQYVEEQAENPRASSYVPPARPGWSKEGEEPEYEPAGWLIHLQGMVIVISLFGLCASLLLYIGHKQDILPMFVYRLLGTTVEINRDGTPVEPEGELDATESESGKVLVAPPSTEPPNNEVRVRDGSASDKAGENPQPAHRPSMGDDE